ncbi:MAG TPA: hypothetical protein DD638_08820 [Pasteurellaceae bacterium]|nr:hypothetical protein [Pasteurellaceae bacterium]
MNITEIHHEISANIVRLRREKDITQEKLANEIGCTQAFINQIETGIKECNVKHLYQIASALNCSVYDILPNLTMNVEKK